MTGSRVLDILGMIVIVGGITAAVLPDRETANVIRALGDSFSNSLGTAITGG